MRFTCFLFFLLLCTSTVHAQTKTRGHFYMIPQAGLLNGDNYVSAQVMLSAGVEKNGWGVGMGAGVDYYKIRTVPVFIEVRKNMSVSNRPLFGYTQLGLDIAAPLATQKRGNNWPWMQWNNEFRNGLYGEIGVGYSFLNRQNKGFQLALGFTTKTIREHFTETVFMNFPPYGSSQELRRLTYTFNRVILKLGYRL